MRNMRLKGKTLISLCVAIGAMVLSFNELYAAKKVQPNRQVLWYTRPASNWMKEALPIGNGRIGAMIFGGLPVERVQFNDKTLWTGSTTVRGAYQNFGDIFIDFGPQGKQSYSEYRRELDLDDALAKVTYKQNGVVYHREYLASYPDNVIAMRFTANKKGKISFSVRMDDAHPGVRKVSENAITISGKLTLLSYYAQLVVLHEGRTIGVRRFDPDFDRCRCGDTVALCGHRL